MTSTNKKISLISFIKESKKSKTFYEACKNVYILDGNDPDTFDFYKEFPSDKIDTFKSMYGEDFVHNEEAFKKMKGHVKKAGIVVAVLGAGVLALIGSPFIYLLTLIF